MSEKSFIAPGNRLSSVFSRMFGEGRDADGKSGPGEIALANCERISAEAAFRARANRSMDAAVRHTQNQIIANRLGRA